MSIGLRSVSILPAPARCALALILVIGALDLATTAWAAAREDLLARQMSPATLPMTFEENHGQSDSQVKFLARTGSYSVFLTQTEAVYVLGDGESQTVLRIRSLAANRVSSVRGLDTLPGKSNYFAGRDPARWHTNIPNYARVLYRNIYPGIDLAYHGNQGQLEYDWIVRPGADPRAIRFSISGATHIRIDDGDLVAETAAGTVRNQKLVVYQEVRGTRRYVNVRYVLKGNEVAFDLGAYDKSVELVIDPTLIFTALVGGSRPTIGGSQRPFIPPRLGTPGVVKAIGRDAAQNIYMLVFAGSRDFPTTGSIGTGGGIWILKINAAGTALLFSTQIGPITNPYGAMAVDDAGNSYITAYAGSGFPITPNAYQSTCPADPFCSLVVAKLDPSGSSLVYSTFLGGSSGGFAIAVDAMGNAYVASRIQSSSFPLTQGALQRCGGDPKGQLFVTKLNPLGTGLSYSACVGDGSVAGIAVDALGNAYVAGTTTSATFPTTSGSFQPTFSGGNCGSISCPDGFVFKLNSSGSDLLYSTYLGGYGIDNMAAIAIDNAGSVYVTGETSAGDFPTSNPIQSGFQGGDINDVIFQGISGDAFISKLNPSGSALVFSTYLGGGRSDAGAAIAVDAFGNVYVTGSTDSRDFPLVNPILGTLNGGSPLPTECLTLVRSTGCVDAFIVKLDSSGSAIVYSTYFGGNFDDFGSAITVDNAGNAYVAGQWGTSSAVFPVVGPIQQTKGVGGAFLIKLADSATATPLVSANSVTNAARPFTSGLPLGGIATLFGKGITNVTGIVSATSMPLPAEISGTSVILNGIRAPLLAVANVDGKEQVNFQVPSNLAPPLVLRVSNNGSQSFPILVPISRSLPGIFTIDGTRGAILHSADFRPVTPSDPAAKGEVVVIYATGLGPVQPDPGLGNPASDAPLSVTTDTVSATVGGATSEVLFSGLAPGFVGLNQVNIRIPDDAPSGDVDVVLAVTFQNFSTRSSPVKLAVR